MNGALGRGCRESVAGGPKGGVVHSYADHRMATAGTILGLAVAGVEVEDIATTAKTMPDFPQLWEAMLAQGPAADEDTAGGTQH